MIKVSQEISNYVYLNANQLILPTIFSAFDLLDKFNVPFYEDKYFNIIYSEDTIDHLDTFSIFRETLCRDLELIIRSHKIHLLVDPAPTMNTLITIADALYRIQNLEDYYMIERVLSTSNPNELKVAQILNMYTELDIIAALDAIEKVDDVFIEVLQDLINVKRNELKDGQGIDPLRIITTTFFKYIGDQETIGGYFFNRGFDKPITFKEFADIIPINIANHLNEQYKKGPAYAALDTLSLLILCSDTREQPVNSFKAISEDLYDNSDKIAVVYNILVNMHNEFMNHYREVIKETIDENNKQI